MATTTDSAAVDAGDVHGVVLAVAAVVAAVATFLVTPGSGVGPAALAIVAWLAVVWTASWATFVDGAASVWHRIRAAVFAVAVGAGFVALIESVWALAFPAVALVGALGRKRSAARFVAVAAWLAVIGHMVVGAEPQ